MTTHSWTKAASADWKSPSFWSGGTPNSFTEDAVITVGGNYTVSIVVGESIQLDSLLFDPGTGTLALNGTLTLGGLTHTMTQASGTVTIIGTIAGGTVTLAGGVLHDTGAGVITSAINLGGGAVTIDAGKTLALSGSVAWNSGVIAGPGTLATSGTMTIGAPGGADLDGGLTWKNTGVVSVIDVYTFVGQNTTTNDTYAVINQVGGIFNLTASAVGVFTVFFDDFHKTDTITFTNAGLLASSGLGTVQIYATLNNTGSISVASGTLELGQGGAEGGTITVASGGSLRIDSTATLSGAVANNGALLLDSNTTMLSGTVANTAIGTVEIGGTVTLTGKISGGAINMDAGLLDVTGTNLLTGTTVLLNGGTISLESGVMLTLSGPIEWNNNSEVLGPGTLVTTGTTTIDQQGARLDSYLTWTNSGTVLVGSPISSGSGNIPNQHCSIVNRGQGIFDLTTDGIQVFNAPARDGNFTTFTNAGLVEMTGGTLDYFEATLNSSGTVKAATGTLDLTSGGSLGGTVTISAIGELALVGGAFVLGGTLVNGGTFAVGGATLDFTATTLAIANSVSLSAGTVDIVAGQTLTLTGPVDWDGGTVGDAAGKLGTLATSGMTTVEAGGAAFFVGLTWTNSGTVLENASDTAIGGAVTIVNQAPGTFEFTAAVQSVFDQNGATSTFINAGLLETTAAGIVTFYSTLDSSGTVTATVGTLELVAGGTLGGSIGGTGLGLVQFAGHVIARSGVTFTTTGSLTILDAGANDGLSIVAGAAWIISGTVADGGQVAVGGASDSGSGTNDLAIAIGGNFDFTSDHGNLGNLGGETLTNAGTVSKTGGTGTSSIDVAVSGTGGTITATSGTLALDGGGTLDGSIGGTGSGTVLLLSASFTTDATAVILDAPGNTDFRVVAGAGWLDAGTIDDFGAVALGNAIGNSSLTIATGASFAFTGDDGAITIASGQRGVLSNAGTVAKTGGTGTSTITGGFVNSGTVDVASGTLKLTAIVAGAGLLRIESGGTLELASGAAAGTNTIGFGVNALGATLKLDASSSSVGLPMLGLGVGSRIDLAATPFAPTPAIAKIAGKVLTVTPNGGKALNFTSSASLAGLHAEVTSDGNGGTLVTLYNQAVASKATPTLVTFGIVHVNDSKSQVITVGNVAPGGIYAESLAATLGTTATGFTATGSVDIAPGGDSGAALMVMLNTKTANTISGTATLALSSDGSGGGTSLSSQTVTVSGTVNNYAVPTFQSSNQTITGPAANEVINLGTLNSGAAAPTVTLDVLNNVSGPADLLSGTFEVANAAGFTVSGFGAISAVGALQKSATDIVTLSTTTSGTFSETIILDATGSNASGYSGNLAAETLTITGVVQVPTYTLTAQPTTIAAAQGYQVFIATGGVLNSRDNISGAANTSNQLQLSGGGVFDLNAPQTLANIQTVTASEGQGSASQVVFLRDALNVTLNVASPTAGSIAIYGGNDASVMNLGAGSDFVMLGSAREVIHGGAGHALIQTVAAFAGALVAGATTTTTTLEIINAGTATLNTATTLATVLLDGATNLTLSKMGFITAIGEVAGNSITALAAGQTLEGLAGGDTLTGYSGFGDTFLGPSAGLNGDTIGNFGSTDVIHLTDLKAGTRPTYTAITATKGVLFLTDGTHSASVTMLGSFGVNHFHVATDGGTGCLITYS